MGARGISRTKARLRSLLALANDVCVPISRPGRGIRAVNNGVRPTTPPEKIASGRSSWGADLPRSKPGTPALPYEPGIPSSSRTSP